MSTPSNAFSGSFDSRGAAPATVSSTRSFFWSVRREFWEYRSLYIAPLGRRFSFPVRLHHQPDPFAIQNAGSRGRSDAARLPGSF